MCKIIASSQPIMICGAPGSGTSFVTKVLRYSGFFAGADAGPVEDRKFHESKSFRNANNRILQSTIGFPHAPKSVEQFQEHLQALESGLCRLVELINLSELLHDYWSGNSETKIWGWKDPRNSANVLLWRKLFPKLRVITIRKKWSRRERRVSGSQAGNWFRADSTKELRQLYSNPPHVEGLDVFDLDFEQLMKGEDVLKRLWGWLGIVDVPDCRQFKSLVGFVENDG